MTTVGVRDIVFIVIIVGVVAVWVWNLAHYDPEKWDRD